MGQNNQKSSLTVGYMGASALALLFGVFVLMMSLRSFVIQNGKNDIDVKDERPLAKLIEKRIVPGHPAYPLFMVRDWVRLTLTRESRERSRLMVELARDRLLSALDVYSTQEHQLALSTLTKAEVYLGRAAEELVRTKERGGEVSQYDLKLLLDTIDVHIVSIQAMKSTMTDSEKVQCDQLIGYTMSLHDTMIGFSRTSFSQN